MKYDIDLKKVLICLLLILAAVISLFPIAKSASSVEAHDATIRSIDSKIETVLKLTATSTLTSVGISAIPSDTATPIAEKVADFTEYFMLILCVLYSEKYLLTIIGAATFKILIPIACVLFTVSLFWHRNILQRLGVKMILAGLALYFMIPLSVQISDTIYNTYLGTINETITAAEAFTDTTAELSEADEDEGVIRSIMARISETATTLSDKAARLLNNFVESLAVMIVTSCIIPLLVLLFSIWLIKMLTGIQINIPDKLQLKRIRLKKSSLKKL